MPPGQEPDPPIVPPKKPPGLSHESWVDRLIREAQERGEFDGLPGAGEPLPDADAPYDENWWLKKKLERERVSGAPEALRLRLEVQRMRESLADAPTEAALRKAVRRANELVRRANLAPAPSALPLLKALDEERELRRWRSRRGR